MVVLYWHIVQENGWPDQWDQGSEMIPELYLDNAKNRTGKNKDVWCYKTTTGLVVVGRYMFIHGT